MSPVCVSFFFFLMIRRPPRSTLDRSSAASDVYKRQVHQDLPEALINDIDDWAVAFDRPINDIDKLITGNRIFKQRNVDIGKVTRQELSLIHISEPTRPY